VLVRANRDGLPNRQVWCRDERGRHRRRRLSNRNDVQSAPGEDLRHVAIGDGPLDHATSANRVHTGADDVVEIFSESGNGNRQ
jgi:hypothetical protein